MSDTQAATLPTFKEQDTALWKAYTLKEALRYLCASDLDLSDITRMIKLWCDRAISRRADGFRSAKALLALVMVACGPIDLRLPDARHART